VVTFTIVGMAASAWLGSTAAQYNEHLTTGAVLPVTVVAGLLVGSWLRSQKPYFAWTIIGTFSGTEFGVALVHTGHVSLRDPHLSLSPWTVSWAILAALGLITALVAIVSGAVSGHRNPLLDHPQADPKAALTSKSAGSAANSTPENSVSH
jgi:hypothetical protein